MYFLGVRRQEVPNHGGLPARCGELVGLLVQVVAHDFLGAFTRQDLRGAESLDAAARVNRDDRDGSLGRALGQPPGELALALSCEQGAEVLLELPTYRLRRLQASAAALLAGRQLHPIGREAVAHQPRAHALRIAEAVEDRQ
jgi:hypothetical protein